VGAAFPWTRQQLKIQRKYAEVKVGTIDWSWLQEFWSKLRVNAHVAMHPGTHLILELSRYADAQD